MNDFVLLLCGSFLVLSIYYIYVFLGRRNDLSNLAYGLYCITSCALLYIAHIDVTKSFFFNKDIYNIFYIIIGCSVSGATTLFIFIIFDIKKLKVLKWIIYIFYAFNFLLCIFCIISYIFTKNILFRKIFFLFLGFYSLVGFIFIIYSYVKLQLYKKRKQTTVFISFLIVPIFSFVFGIFVFRNIKMHELIIYIVFTIHFLIIAFALTDSFNQEHKDLKELKNNLDHKVIERTKELEDAFKEIKKANALKTNFFQMLTHEAMHHTTVIFNNFPKSINLLKKYKLKPEIYILNDVIWTTFQKLHKQLNDFLIIEKYQRGDDVYNELCVIDLKNILYEKIKMFKLNSENKKIKINLEIINIKNANIKIDPKGLDIVLNNLIDNAIKYNKENGEIFILLKKVNDNFILKIKDTGIGIPKEELNNIFEPYYRISKRYYGFGLGLSIVKKIMNRINGKISAESIINKGTTFTLLFPASNEIAISLKKIEISKPISNEIIKLKPEKFNKNLATIFIIDDDINIIKIIQDEFYSQFNIYYAFNGKEAILKINNIPTPHLIISDIMMPEMDGIEFGEMLKKSKKYNLIPFIFLTAKDFDIDKIKAYSKTGSIDYITKPFDLLELYYKISNIVNKEKISRKYKISYSKFNKYFNRLLKKEITKLNITKKENLKDKIIFYGLSKKEEEVIKLIIKGKEYKEIADILGISINTVRTHVRRIFNKCNVINKSQLLKCFYEN